MSDTLMLLFIFGPILALLIVVGYLTRNDPISTEVINKHREQVKRNGLLRVYQVEEFITWIVLPIVVLFLFGTLWGSLILIITGVSFFFHEKIFHGSYLMAGKISKAIGITHLVFGVICLLFFN